MIELHDDRNPDQVKYVVFADISAIEPFGSGSSICLKNGCHVSVHETPSEIYQKREQQ